MDSKALKMKHALDGFAKLLPQQLLQLVNEDRHIITQNSAEEVGISKERISHILHEELGMRKLCKKCVMLHHDNAAPHSSKTVTKYLKQERVNILPHPPYSPDLTPCDFFLLPKIKKELKNKKYNKVENFARAVQAITSSIPKEEYHRSFEDWRRRLELCIDKDGHYFERMK